MAGGEESISAAWQNVLDKLETDDRITPQLHGFLSLVEPKGIMAGTFYLEVPNEFTRGMIEQRSRVPLLNAIGSLDQTLEVNTFAIVVNPGAGSQLGGDSLTELRARLPRARVIELEDGVQLEDALKTAASEVRVLGIAGGDGSLTAAAEAALERSLPLLALPAGTLNHLARDLRAEDMDDMLRALAAGELVGVDVATIDGRLFLNSAGFGAYPEMLAEREIPFEVCPGITAAAGCSAYSGIPLTHRDHAQACIFVTAQGKNGPVDIDWNLLLRPGQTVAIYMGLAHLDELMREFIARGADPDLAAAVVDNGTRRGQRVVTGTLRTLAAKEVVAR